MGQEKNIAPFPNGLAADGKRSDENGTHLSVASTYNDSTTTQKVKTLPYALAYAKLGLHVFPAHTPIFDGAGNCVGCTCEDWKRGQPQYGPNYVCPQPGKCPRVRWSEVSTTDADQIRVWWKWWPSANIGIDAGKSGLLLVDADTYKDKYTGGVDLDDNTVVTVTGNGGRHNWYRQPEGKQYGNATGKLPDGIDIRGHGGYVIAPGSLHYTGKRYTFLDGHSPKSIEIASLPQALVDALESTQDAQDGPTVTLPSGYVPVPNLDHLALSGDTWELIQNGAPKGERSEADWQVTRALVKAGATDDEIYAVFYHYAIGDKFQERGDKYLARTISNARKGHVSADDPTLALALAWVNGPDCIEVLRAAGIRRVADYVPLLGSIVELAIEHRTIKVATTQRDLAIRNAVKQPPVRRKLIKLADGGIIGMVADKDKGTLIDLSPIVAQLELKVSQHNPIEADTFSSSSKRAFIQEHRLDDAFRAYPYRYAIKRRVAPTVLANALGATALLLWPEIEVGGTIKDLAERSSLTVAAVRSALKKMWQAGLLYVWQDGRALFYELHPDAENRLDERREHMVTDGVGLLNVGHSYSGIANFAQLKLQSRTGLEPGERAKLLQRRDRADEMARECFAALERRGIKTGRIGKVDTRVNPIVDADTLAALTYEELMALDIDGGPRVPKPSSLRYDLLAEFIDYGRAILETYHGIGDDLDKHQCHFLLMAEGYTQEQIDNALSGRYSKIAKADWARQRAENELEMV